MTDALIQLFAGGLDISGIPKTAANESTIQIIMNIVFVISGAIAVLMVVISGIRFIASQGNPSETAKARNGIIWALLGILIIIFAASIVNFVIFKVT
ncbi:MAG: hypothetical protein ACREGD_04535 [Candidatus Saccharimonadales bacterium]